MDSLPQEIFDTICTDYFRDRINDQNELVPFHQLPVNRPLLATVSQKWQVAIERQSFRQIYLKSTELEIFRKIVTGHRRRFLKRIRYTIILPDYSQDACTQFESNADRYTNDTVFTAAISGLFQVLYSWGPMNDVGDVYSIDFHLEDVYSPTDYSHRAAPGEATMYRWIRAAETIDGEARPRDIENNRFLYSELHLLPQDDLPSVPAIRFFSMDLSKGRKRMIALSTVIEILEKLPNLSSWWVRLFEPTRSYPSLCQASHDAFVQALGNVSLPPLVSYISLFILQEPIRNQSWRPSRRVPLGCEQDPVDNLLRTVTADLPRLLSLTLEGCIGPSLLWPYRLTMDVKPFWQHLRRLVITFNLTTPFGDWYFDGEDRAGTYPYPIITSALSETQMPPGYGTSQGEDAAAALRFSSHDHQIQTGFFPADNIFRVRVNEQRMIPLIEAFCRACLQIPSLNQACLWTTLDEPVEFEGRVQSFPAVWGLFYSAPGQYHTQFPTKLSYPMESAYQRTLTLDVRDWRLPEEVYSLWQQIGRGKYGDRVVERYIDSWGSTRKPQILEELASGTI